MANPPTVACPQCAAAVVWTPASAWRPFCSERCRLIDLGAWANETYRVQAAPPDEEDSQPEMPRGASGLRDDG